MENKENINEAQTASNTQSDKLKIVRVKHTTQLNLRQAPTVNSEVLEVLKPGTELQKMKDANTKWMKVKTSNNLIGFCMSEFISEE